VEIFHLFYYLPHGVQDFGAKSLQGTQSGYTIFVAHVSAFL